MAGPQAGDFPPPPSRLFFKADIVASKGAVSAFLTEVALKTSRGLETRERGNCPFHNARDAMFPPFAFQAN
jgi:hypothetical protein